MRVICAGFGRTGTASLKSALETLLGEPCYHFEEIFRNAEHRQKWSQFALGKSHIDWVSLYSEYGATVDFPSCAYYRELTEAFPDALVILSVRNLESWADSWTGLWFYLRFFRLLRWIPWVGQIVNILDHIIRDRTFHGDMSRKGVIATHKAHIETVKETIQPSKLLVYRVQEGWEPLCTALNTPVPETEFPRHNAGNTPLIRRVLRKMFTGRWRQLGQ